MSQFIETLRIYKGKIQNLEEHNARFNHTRKTFFPLLSPIDLTSLIEIPELFGPEDIVKCRIVYKESSIKVGFEKYKKAKIESIKLVNADHIDYAFKYSDRQKLKELHQIKGDCDDILMVKNGMITDTYYCNVALRKNNQWFTPSTPLLLGTQRSYLLKNNILKELLISKSELPSFEKIALFNAMIPFDEKIEINIENIYS